MKRKIFFLSILLFTSFFFTVSFAQKDTVKTASYISDIEKYMKYVDTTGKYTGMVTDGIICNRNGKHIGGFGFDVFTNVVGDSVVKIIYHDNLDINIYKTCYYKNNLLVAAILKLASNIDDSFPYIRKEFFRDNRLFSSTVLKNMLKKKKHISKTKTILLDDGLGFFKEYGKI